MKLEKTFSEAALHDAAQTLHSEYGGYDVVEARHDLENRLIAADLSREVDAHPSQTHPVETLSDTDDSVVATQDWRVQASCRDDDPEQLFVRGAEQRKAKVVCLSCPVRTECLSEALDNRIEFGVWGGLTERERRALLRRRPDVDSWYELLQSARREHSEPNDASSRTA